MKKTRKSLLTLFFTLAICNAYSQVGINNQDPKASLDISKMTGLASDGILVPRMTSIELINRHSAGMYGIDQNSALVYVTDITGASGDAHTDQITREGFYYYKNSDDKWYPIASSGSIWNKVGTTQPSENNTDNSYLTAKAVIGGNTIAGVNGGANNAQLTVLGEDVSVRGVTVGTGKGGNSTNSVRGRDALLQNASGVGNVAIGANALYNSTSSIGNTAVGSNSSITANVNGASSFGAVSNAESDYSTAIGTNSTVAESSTSASAFGYYSTIEKNASGSIAIGEGAKIVENSRAAIALGKHAVASAENAIAIGEGAFNNKKDAAFLKSRNSTIGNSLGNSNVTLEITGERNDPSKADGILIPIVTLGQLNAKDGEYAGPQFGTLVFVDYVGDGTATGKTEYVSSYGFYFYDFYNIKGGRWTKLSDAQVRRSSVNVGPGEYYTTLQDAYNQEAKKLYNQNGAPVEFVCSGEVGGLTTDGSIPFIRITSDGTMTVSDKDIIFNNTKADLVGKIDMSGFNMTAYNSDLVALDNAEIIANGLIIDRSSFKAIFGGNNFTLSYLTCFNGFIDMEGASSDTNLTLTGGDSRVQYLVSATNGAYILFAHNINIVCNATNKQYSGFSITNSSTVYCNTVKKISFDGSYATDDLSYDIYASSIGSIIFDECHDINGTSKPDFIMAGTHRSNIVCYQSIIERSTSTSGLSVVSGISLSVIGDRSSMKLQGSGAVLSKGIISVSSSVVLSSISATNPMITLENFDIGIEATGGGVINAMNRIKRTTNINTSQIPATNGVASKTGAIIYDSDTEV